MKNFLLLVWALSAAACDLYRSPYQEGPTLGENPELLGPNITEEIRAGDFFLGPHDTIQIQVFGHTDLNQTARVAEDGTAYFHLIREQYVAGLSQQQLRQKLVQEYSRYLVDPSLECTISGSPRRKVTVLGSIGRPGLYPLANPRTTILDLIAEAGGLSGDADKTGVLISRLVDGQRQVKAYDLDLLFNPADARTRTEIPYVQPDDLVYVLRSPDLEFSDDLRILNDIMRLILIGERVVQNSARLDVAISGD